MLLGHAYEDKLETQKKSPRTEAPPQELSAELAAAKLNAALEAGDLESFMLSLSEVIKARGGYTAAARSAGLNRTALYKVASRGGNPALNTLVPLLESLGLGLSIKVLEESPGDEGMGEAQESSRHAQAQEISLPE
jgi:probable addiction module antidote protein